MRTSIQQLAALQRFPANIRNICILAHVDHGKTTLADALVASNGIISKRMAGKLRYLDNRDDEQLRGITMKSSAISLQYINKDENEYLVNLIDTPGHIDFSSEVSTAVRLCDGAIILVDVVEGVCPQTVVMLRQAWLEDLHPVLVLNKIDRLVCEWKMSPTEAHIHLAQVLEQVNAVTGELFASEVMKNASWGPEHSAGQATENTIYDWSSGLDDADDSNIYFSPDEGNVVFASTLDGWGFGVEHFAVQWAAKLGIDAGVLKKTLWGDFYWESKTKQIRKGAQAKGRKALFVQLVLEQVWAVYEAVISRNKEKVEKIVKTLKLKILERDYRQNDPRVLIQAVCTQWLPLSQAVLEMVVLKLPSPLNISLDRAKKLLCPATKRFSSLESQTQGLKDNILACSPSAESPVIVLVSKMLPISKSLLPGNRRRILSPEELAVRHEAARARNAEKMSGKSLTSNSGETELKPFKAAEDVKSTEKPANSSDETFVAFARVFSGTVRKGQKLYVLGSKHDPAKALKLIAESVEPGSPKTVQELSDYNHTTVATIDSVFLFMGRELEMLEEIPAGNIVGLGGLEEHVLKSATLSSTVACPSFTGMRLEATPIVRVAIEPKKAENMSAIITGMRLLNQSDPSVEVLVQENGQHVIIATGEVHLQKCIDDLQNQFAKVEIKQSSPIVPFRETIILPEKTAKVNESNSTTVTMKGELQEDGRENIKAKDQGTISLTTPNQACSISVLALPLPETVVSLLEENKDMIKSLVQHTSALVAGNNELQQDHLNEETVAEILELRHKLDKAFSSAGPQWEGAVEQIWAFGPRGKGPNVLLNQIKDYERPNMWDCLEENKNEKSLNLRDFDSSVVSGFQMATQSGPLCEEPMRGVAFIVEDWRILQVSDSNEKTLGQNAECQDESQEMPDVQNLLLCDNKSKQGSESEYFKMGVAGKQGSPFSSEEATACAREQKVAGTVEDKTASISSKLNIHGPLSGQLMSIMKDACRRAFQCQPQRLMVAMYTCDIQVTSDVLGKMYAVLGKRRGRIQEEDLLEGSSLFKVKATLPVIESFGFAEEMRKRTSGMASPQLRFTHWEVVDIDPFWVPRTEEEYLHFGEKADSENVARQYMNKVRQRKGLRIDQKFVEFGEKQRTLSKNK